MAERSLFGEFSQPTEGMDLGTSKGFVMSGLEKMLQEGMGKAGQVYNRQGWGQYVHAPSVESAIRKPWIEQAAETGRNAMTDLWFKDREQKLKENMWAEQYDVMEDSRKRNRQIEEGGKVLCGELYRQKLLPLSHIKADLFYLKYYVDEETHKNYLAWSRPLVAKMQKSKLLTYLVWPFIRLWSGYMKAVVYGKKIPLSGLLIHKLGINFGKLYKIISTKRAVA